MPQSLTLVTLLAYGLTTFLLLQRWQKQGRNRPTLALVCWSIGLLTHAGLLATTLHSPQGLDLSLPNALSLVAWITAALLLGGALRYPVTGLGLVILPLTMMTIASRLVIPSEGPAVIEATPGLEAHIVLSLLAYSVLAIAAVQSLLIAYQDHHLRTHKLKGWVRKLPPLQNMESLLFHVLMFGFVFLTLSLVSGFLFLDDLFAQHVAHKTFLSITAWIIFGTLIAGRLFRGWRGRKAIRWTLTGFAFLMVSYFGSKLVVEFFLNAS